jgi:hypothetical protein
MTAHPARRRARSVAVLCGIAAIAAIGAAALGPAAAAAPARPSQPSSGAPVVVNCAGHVQIRPARYILACADGNAYLTGLHWAAWGSAAAFAAGTDTFRVCIPTCVAGHLHSFPALAALWRAEPLPAHPGQRYFTRLTIIYTGTRSYTAGGKTYRLRQTATYPLSPFGGA